VYASTQYYENRSTKFPAEHPQYSCFINIHLYNKEFQNMQKYLHTKGLIRSLRSK